MKVFNTPLEEVRTQLRRENYPEAIWPRLLDIKTYQYTKEEVEKLLALCRQKIAEREDVKNTTVVQMWKNNLTEL
jgi:DNA topoisomerase-2